MKKFWIIMLSLGLIAAFSMPAAATDVKIGGYYFAAGYYESNMELREAGPSAAWYGQRIRFEPEFKIAEGLSFNARVDAMERVWGQYDVGAETTPEAYNTRNKAGAQNIQFKRGWVTFLTGIGQFRVGYMAAATWGTDFQDNPTEGAEIVYVTKAGPVVLVAVAQKISEGRFAFYPKKLSTTVYPAGTPIPIGDALVTDITPGGNTLAVTTLETTGANVDSDVDKYALSAIYPWDAGSAGVMWVRIHSAATRPLSNPSLIPGTIPYGQYKTEVDLWCAYFKGTFGPLYMEGEWMWSTGKSEQYDDHIVANDIDQDGMTYYLMAKYNIGPAYVGVQYGYSEGDDLGTADKNEEYAAPGYGVWQPTLILFNDWLDRWRGPLGDGYGNSTAKEFTNAHLYQIFAGYNPIPKLGIKASYAYAQADRTAPGIDDEYGSEADLSVTYKIFDNLEYMVGFGYLWTGDYYKGSSATNKIDDDYLLMHQLTLTF